MIRAVLDTNVLISAIFWSGAPAKVYDAAAKRRFTSLTSELLLTELNDVLSRPKFAAGFTAKQKTPAMLIAEYRELAELVDPVPVPPDIVRDPKDKPVLACAVGGSANFIVSGDKDLQVLLEYQGISIVTADQFLQHIASQHE